MSQLRKQRKQLRKITRESNVKREPSYSARDTQPAFEIINCNGMRIMRYELRGMTGGSNVN